VNHGSEIKLMVMKSA